MKTLLIIAIIVLFYAVTLAGIHALFGLFFAAFYALFGLPFAVVVVDDALSNYSFFQDEV